MILTDEELKAHNTKAFELKKAYISQAYKGSGIQIVQPTEDELVGGFMSAPIDRREALKGLNKYDLQGGVQLSAAKSGYKPAEKGLSKELKESLQDNTPYRKLIPTGQVDCEGVAICTEVPASGSSEEALKPSVGFKTISKELKKPYETMGVLDLL